MIVMWDYRLIDHWHPISISSISKQPPSTDVSNTSKNLKPFSNWRCLCVSCKMYSHFISHFAHCRVCNFAFYMRLRPFLFCSGRLYRIEAVSWQDYSIRTLSKLNLTKENCCKNVTFNDFYMSVNISRNLAESDKLLAKYLLRKFTLVANSISQTNQTAAKVQFICIKSSLTNVNTKNMYP